MNIARILKEQINQERPVLGVLCTNHIWPGMVALFKDAGLDYLIVDLEHGPHAEDVVAQVCDIGRLSDFPVLIRTVSCDYSVVRRAMDFGPCGLMLPCVDDVQQLNMVRDAVWMPPRGKRRPGGPGNDWVSDYNYTTWRTEVEPNIIILPQIESRNGLANANLIAAHELTTAIAIGPYDLSADLGCCYDPEHADLLGAIEDIRESGRLAGKNMWILGDGPTLVEKGFTFICIGEPTVLLKQSVSQIVAQIRGNTVTGRSSVAEHG